MAGLSFRCPTIDELPELTQRLVDSGGEVINLWTTPCWVAEQDGNIVGMLPIRLHWQFEPLYIFPEVTSKATRGRACYGLYKAAEAWISGPLNGTGIYRAFAITRMLAVRSWAKKMGWLHQYQRAPLFIKNFRRPE
jgi:hypothetical protein